MSAPRFRMNWDYEAPLADNGFAEAHPHKAAELATAKWTGELLMRHYPGHPWRVEVEIGKINARDGLIKIRLDGIMPPNYWFLNKLSDVASDPGGKRTVLKGAGEILERYNLHRGKFDGDNWRTALNAMPISRRMTSRGHLAPLID